MKKSLKVFASLLAVAALLSVSCTNKKDVPSGEPAPAAQEDNAGLLTIDNQDNVPVIISGQEDDVDLESIEFMRGGAYSGKGRVPASKALAPGDPVYFGGTFTFKDGVYTLKGALAGTIKVDGNKLSINLGGKTYDNIQGSFTKTPAPSNNIEKALCVSWKITSLEASLEKPAAKHKWTGAEACNLKAIAEYINEKGGDLDADALKDYVIKSISISPAPKYTILVDFEKSGIAPVVGTWNAATISNGTFTYSMVTGMSGEFFQTNASGKFSFSADYKTVTLTVNIASTYDDLKGTVILTCTAI